MRPSAFGPPRPSAPPLSLMPSAPSEAIQTPISSAAARAEEQQTLDIEALPAPAAAEERSRSLPSFFAALPSLRPVWRESAWSEALRGWPRRTRISVALFGSMLALSAITLLRYAGPSDPQHARTGSQARADNVRRAVESTAPLAPKAGVVVTPHAFQAESAPAVPEADRASLILALRQQADRALARRNTGEAEELYAHILELEDGNARAAHGLARVRLAQGNLTGAEGWIQLAIRKRPRRAAYHALYAEILTQLGRKDDALEERLRASGGSDTEGADGPELAADSNLEAASAGNPEPAGNLEPAAAGSLEPAAVRGDSEPTAASIESAAVGGTAPVAPSSAAPATDTNEAPGAGAPQTE